MSFVSDRLFQDFTYTVRHGLIQGMKRKGGLGFLPAAFARSPQGDAEVAFLKSLDLRDRVVYDIGAFQGIMTLFFARQAKTVVTYEPHPASYRRLLENLTLNRLTNVVVLNRAVGRHEGTLHVTYDPLLPGAASGNPSVRAQILSSESSAVSLDVPMVPLDVDIEKSGLPAPDFIKIDIEGMEAAALEGMEGTLLRCRPALYIEMHGATDAEKLDNATAVISFLTRVGYQDCLHIESAIKVGLSNTSIACQGHIYCAPRP